MRQIAITNIPNQTLSVQLDGNAYDIRLHACRDSPTTGVGIMTVTLTRNNVLLVSGERLVAGFPIIPYLYLEAGDGNFIVNTQNQDYPDWRQFGVSQFLLYASNAELEALRGGSPTN